MYTGATTGVTTNEGQHAFFINENGLPAVKSGSQTIVFSTSGSAFTGSSGSSGANGSSGASGTSGVSGTSGQDGAPGETGAAGSNGTNGVSGTSGINGADGVAGTSGISGSTGSAGTSGISYGTSGSSGATGSSGSSGANGTNGLTALGAASKAGSVNISGFTYNPTTQMYNKAITFSTPFANTNYSTAFNVLDTTNDNVPEGFYPTPIWSQFKTVSGFTIDIAYDLASYTGATIEWLAVSQGETGVAGAPGSSGTSGATGSSGVSGTSGTSAPGGGGVVEDTQYSFYVGPSADQPTLTANRHQWHSVYGDGLQLDQGNGGAYVDQEYGFIMPITLHAGETLDTLGVYVNETATSGTAEMKLMIMDKHPDAFLPNNIVQTNTLTWTLEGIGNKWVSWDMNFTHTGSTNEVYFVWQLFSSKSTNPYDICRTVIYPPYLTYDYRQVGGYLYDNRFDKTGHWMTQGTSVYNSIPANFLTIMSSGQFTYTHDRGGHFYYQTSRP